MNTSAWTAQFDIHWNVSSFLLQHGTQLDNGCWPHVSAATMQWYADNNVHRLDWPAQSPDLNPIEHLWDELDRRLRSREMRPTSIVQLSAMLQEEWRRIPVDILHKLVESMPDRVAAVIATRVMPRVTELTGSNMFTAWKGFVFLVTFLPTVQEGKRENNSTVEPFLFPAWPRLLDFGAKKEQKMIVDTEAGFLIPNRTAMSLLCCMHKRATKNLVSLPSVAPPYLHSRFNKLALGELTPLSKMAHTIR
ncbi:hypothetical protein ANN_22145 [Periplaneta americana]|uniref:Tc1-like transposase DDE domain-containing protein n=1 Tax=Periplaneta americana TaxID=6978 RepID=A0ABQ8S7E0_PERAM|nr:hypothetical protein ANN_22145 [Periplaneta americana]